MATRGGRRRVCLRAPAHVGMAAAHVDEDIAFARPQYFVVARTLHGPLLRASHDVTSAAERSFLFLLPSPNLLLYSNLHLGLRNHEISKEIKDDAK